MASTDSYSEERLSQTTPFPRWAYLFILLAALFASVSIYRRYQAESLNRAASLAVEYETVEALAASQAIGIPQALALLKDKGLGSVILSEEIVSDLVLQGFAEIRPASDAGLEIPYDPPVLRVFRPADAERVRRGLVNRVGAGFGQAAGVYWGPRMSMVRGIAIGLHPEAAANVRAAGLTLVARKSNPAGVTDAYVQDNIRWAREAGAEIFLPQGEQVLGRRDSLRALVDALKASEMLYASPEFTKIGGDANVVAMAPEIVVRLHSAQAAELDKLPLEEAVERYARAARERNQRMLLLRPVSFASAKPLEEFGRFISLVRTEIGREGGAVGKAKPFTPPRVPAWVFLAIGLSVAPVIWAVAAAIVPSRRLQVLAALFLGALASACFVEQGRPYMAFLAAVSLPIAAFLMLDREKPMPWLFAFLGVSAISLVGGLCVAGLLNGLPYYIRADQFPGVKASVFLPVMVVGGYFFWRLSNPRAALAGAVTWSQAVLALAILAGLGLMLTRTGNDNPAAVSSIELKFRSLLDTLLFVRPRTKEFLIGHPLLIVGIGLLAAVRSKGRHRMAGWTALVLMAGAVGQTSIVNTLSHLHTPVTLSLARVGVGVVAGGILGAVLWGLVSRWQPKGEA